MTTRAPLAPLLSAKTLAPVAARLLPFREAGILQAVDVHVVDHLAVLMGETDPDVALALALAVRAPRHGHICIDLPALRMDELLAEPEDGERHETIPAELPEDRWQWVVRVGLSRLVGGRESTDQPFVLDGNQLYPTRYFAYQKRLALAVRTRIARLQPPADAALLKRGLQVLFAGAKDGGIDRQKLAAAMAVLRGFTVISGGPGTGKTYTVRSVLTLLWAQWAASPGADGALGPRTSLAAPTGKAASRMKEAMLAGLDEFLAAAQDALPPGRTAAELRSYLLSLEPSTIHRLLRRNPWSPTRFLHDALRPLPAEVVVVDETSMVDFALMTKLVDAVAPDSRLVLLGDQRQLASVEAGTVLADLCGPTSMKRLTVSRGFGEELRDLAGMPEVLETSSIAETAGPYDAIVQLDRSRRFDPGSGIGRFAKACIADEFDLESAVGILAGGSADADVAVIVHGPKGTLAPAAARQIVEGYRPYLERLLDGRREGETLEQWHTDVLRQFDQFRVLCAHRRGRLGVEGMNQAVAELLAAPSSGLPGLRPEGEFWVGRPVLIERNDYVVKLFNGDVGVVVVDPDGALKVAFAEAGGVRYVAPARLPEHQTVFAMTIHKSQGSEFDHAMVVLPENPSRILTRELVYTGVTRAKRRMTLLTDARGRVLRQGLIGTVRRASGLRDEVWR